MQNNFHTQLLKSHTASNIHARVTEITTPHGKILTPCFMPVATRAYINHMTPQDLMAVGSQIILGGNTYHMLCTPGMEIIQNMGGMHYFMQWHQPMLTDSGGFQVFSLAKNSEICTVNEEGARFKHPINGKIIFLNAQSSIDTQKIIGADIIMAFDQCTSDAGGRESAVKAMLRTHRWLLDSKNYHEKNPNSSYGLRQALFGIIQGGRFRDLREESAEFILAADLDGIAIGGESIGFDMGITAEILSWIVPGLPDHKARYTMGVGLYPQDLIDVVEKGIDLFDCVAPTRNARHGTLYHGHTVKQGVWCRFDTGGEDRGRILIKKAQYARDEKPILENCTCLTCLHYSRSYLHYLFKTKLPLYSHLACIHNLHVMHKTCEMMRACVLAS